MSTDGGGGFGPIEPAAIDYPAFAPPPPTVQYAKPAPAARLVKPGVIPLRPLTLGDIFNGAVNYVRANPRATLGLATVVVVVTEIITLAANAAPLLSLRGVDADADALGSAVALGQGLSSVVTVLTTLITAVLLSGMLTVVIGRAVFGSTITAGQAWTKVRGRLLALIGLTLLQILVVAILVFVPMLFLVVGFSAGGAAAFAGVLAIPMFFVVLVVLVFLYTMVAFAAPLVVLERLPVFAAIRRSFTLVRRGFWRVLGILMLAQVVAYVVTLSVALPFTIAGQIMTLDVSTVNAALIGFALLSVGNAISQILVSPFIAGVTVLLYTDRRMRWEAFDLVLQSGAATNDVGDPDATDHLWLVRQP